MLMNNSYLICASTLIFIFTCLIWYKFFYFFYAQKYFKNKHNLFSSKFIYLKFLLAFIGFLATYLATLGIAQQTQEKQLKVGSDCLILLDVSKSMLAEDCDHQSRLSCAILEIEKILDQGTYGTMGVILFSQDYFTLVPPTDDRSIIKSLLRSLDNNFVVGGDTDIDPALSEAIRVLSQVNSQRSIIIFSDGEFKCNFAAQGQELKKNNIILHSCLVGSSQGAPISIFNSDGSRQGHLKNENGSVVITKASADILEKLASMANGYFWQVGDQAVIEQITKLAHSNLELGGNNLVYKLSSISWIFSCIGFMAFCLERYL
jgi:hypothetical protein